MSTEYSTKKDALETGIYYAGRTGMPVTELKLLDDVHISQFGEELSKSEVYEFINKNGKPAKIATSPFRHGWDLWLIDPESGAAVRT